MLSSYIVHNSLPTIAATMNTPIICVFDALGEYGTPEIRKNLIDVFRVGLRTLPTYFQFPIASWTKTNISFLTFKSGFSAIIIDQRSEESVLYVFTYTKCECKEMNERK